MPRPQRQRQQQQCQSECRESSHVRWTSLPCAEPSGSQTDESAAESGSLPVFSLASQEIKAVSIQGVAKHDVLGFVAVCKCYEIECV